MSQPPDETAQRPRSKKLKRLVLLFVVLMVLAGAAFFFYLRMHPGNSGVLRVYGNVDIREVQIAFQDSGRIAHILVQEGDRVQAGQVLAELEPERFQAALRRSQAQAEAQAQILARLQAGSRPEEIAQARADVGAAQANLDIAELNAQRQRELHRQQFVSKQNLDTAETALKTARATLEHAQQTLKLTLLGPRKEDIASAQHTLEADRATLALSEKDMADTRVLAPEAGIVQTRILEPGDMASPQTPVLTLALDNPVWIRAWLPENALGRIKPGTRAWIESDSWPGERVQAWVGFISPTAEFTPKTVETPELRTELMYRLRIYACNPGHRLRLGMPATVLIPLDALQIDPLPHGCGP